MKLFNGRYKKDKKRVLPLSRVFRVAKYYPRRAHWNALRGQPAFDFVSRALLPISRTNWHRCGSANRSPKGSCGKGGHRRLVKAIHEREQQLRDITDKLLAEGDDSMESHLVDIRNFITDEDGELTHSAGWRSRACPGRNCSTHISEIRMVPQAGNGKSHYVARGKLASAWKQKGWLRSHPCANSLVAGACNASNLLLTGFRLEIVRPAA